MTFQLMTDGGADISDRLHEELDIYTVPLYLHFGNEEYQTGTTIDTEMFNQKLAVSEELPQSAAPSPYDYYQAYKQIDPGHPIIMLSLSDGLSTTYENAVRGQQMILEEEPDRKIEVINSKTASCGIALLMQEAGRKIDENITFEELTSHMRERVEQTSTLFVLKTLENLILGGRLDRFKGMVAKTLSIKPLMKSSEIGAVEITEKVRGDKKAIRRFIEQIGEYSKSFENKVLSMSHCHAKDRAENVLDQIKSTYPFKDHYLADMGPIIATYAGEGGLVISFFND